MKRRVLYFMMGVIFLLNLLARIEPVIASGGALIKVYLNGELLVFDEQKSPNINSDGLLYVPVDDIAKKAGWITELKENAPIIQYVKISNNISSVVEVFEKDGGMHMIINGVEENSAIPYTSNGYVMVPLIPIAEALNCQVEWDAITNSAYVYTPIFGVYSDRWAVVPKVIEVPEVDGKLNDELWNHSVSLKGFMTLSDNKQANPDAEVKLAYDSQNIYVGVNILYPYEDSPSDVRGFCILMAPASSTGTYFSIPVETNPGEVTIRPDWGAGRIDLTNYTAKTQKSEKVEGDNKTPLQWSSEVVIPVSAIKSDGFIPGEEWKINLVTYRIVDRHPIFSTWYPVRKSYYMDWASDRIYNFKADIANEGRMASIFFGDIPKELGSNTNLVRLAAWNPGQVLFEYKNFTEKGFSFPAVDIDTSKDIIQLKWRTPSGKLIDIQDLEVKKTGDRIIVTFCHPSPTERGAYELLMLVNREEREEVRLAIIALDDQSMMEAGSRSLGHKVTVPQGIKKHVEPTATSEQIRKIMELIPDRAGLFYLGAPDNPILAPKQLYDWNFSDPWKIVSKGSKMSFPNNIYPENKVLKVKNAKGEIVEYPYYEDESGKRYFFSANLWYKQREYALTQTKSLASTDPMGAARLLYRFAQVYEGYVQVNDYLWNQYPIDGEAGAPNAYWGGVWNYWYYMDLSQLMSLVNAFKVVRQTDAMEQLSREVGENVERRIVEDMFKPSVETIRSYCIVNGNMDYYIWNGLVSLSKDIGEPDYMHEAMTLMKEYISEGNYLFDGFFKEVTLSYHDQSTNGFLQVMNSMKGWSDPAGFTSPRTGLRLDNLDLSQKFPIINKSKSISQILTYPNGYVFPIYDTWANTAKTGIDMGSLLMPASGIAKLSRNSGEKQAQLYMTFAPKYGHQHFDPLNLALYSNGQELLPDIGYTHSLYRYSSVSTLGHNTVVVDSRDMDANNGKDGGNIEVFAPINNSLQIMRAHQESAYPGVSEYSREPWFIGFPVGDGSEGYVVDLFRVSGGNRHEYTLQGDANHDAKFETDLLLSDYGSYLLPQGTNVTEASTELETGSAEGNYSGYIYVKDVISSSIENGKYQLDLVTKEGDKTLAKMKITGIVEPGSNELFIGKSPSVRTTRLEGSTKDTNDEAKKYFMPKLVLRREGENLRSTFTTVMEPYVAANGPHIESIKHLEVDDSQQGAVALEITYGNVTDIILSSPDYADRPLVVGDITMKGKMGFIRIEDNEVRNMYLVGGTLLKKGNMEVTGEGPATGKILNVLRVEDGDAYNGFVTNSQVSHEMKGKYVTVVHPDGSTHGYKIKDILEKNNNIVIITDDMDTGFTFRQDGSSEMIAFPFKKWTGEHTFFIDNIDTNLGVGTLNFPQDELALVVGDITQLKASLSMGDGTLVELSGAESIQYESSNTNVIRVEDMGEVHVITAVSEGVAAVTAKVIINGVEESKIIVVSVTESLLPVIVGAPKITDIQGNDISELSSLSNLKVSIECRNISRDERSVELVIALCNSEGTIENLVSNGELITSDQIKTISTELTIPDNTEGKYLKVFVLDSLDGIQPLSGMTRFPCR